MPHPVSRREFRLVRSTRDRLGPRGATRAAAAPGGGAARAGGRGAGGGGAAVLEELLLLRLAAANPALTPFRPLFDDGLPQSLATRRLADGVAARLAPP